MDPREQVCHNPGCWAYDRRGEGHIVIHSRRERRYQCKRCAKTFSATTGTALYRAHKPHALVVQVVTVLAHGCPPQAIVAAFGLDERTVARYQAEAGAQCRRVHGHVVGAGRVALGQVQADELRVRIVGGVLWVALALAVASRLWLGGEVSAHQPDGVTCQHRRDNSGPGGQRTRPVFPIVRSFALAWQSLITAGGAYTGYTRRNGDEG